MDQRTAGGCRVAVDSYQLAVNSYQSVVGNNNQCLSTINY